MKISIRQLLMNFMKWSSKMAGKPIAFVLALCFVLAWLIYGLIAGFNDTWLLLINTIATINASLMVFIIQNTQSRESKALHLKIDELIIDLKEAETEIAMIEEIEEEELDKIRELIAEKKRRSLKKKLEEHKGA